MIELILATTLLVSLVGMGMILYKKIPALINLPKTSKNLPQVSKIVDKIKEMSIKEMSKIGRFNHELFLQKILSKIRVLTLKTENKTTLWLEWLRRKKNNHNKNDYWQELKKAKNDDKSE